MKETILKQATTHLIILASFYLIVALYFQPAVFEGKTLKQGDGVTWTGNAKAILDHRAAYKEEPLWTNAMFSGMPAYTISVIFSGELLEHIEQAAYLGLPYPVSIIFISLISFYILMLAFGARPYLAALGAIAFTFFSFTFVSLEAGHNSKVRAMVLAPLVLAGMRYAFNGKFLWGFALASLGAALQIRAGHYQISYYLGFIAVIYGISEFIFAITKGNLRDFVLGTFILIVAGGIGAATNAGRLFTLQEYTQYSMRGKPELTLADPNKPKDGGLDRDYVFSWSNAKLETFTLLIPGFYGGSSTETIGKKSVIANALKTYNVDLNQFPQAPLYWGDQPFTSGPVYAGAIIIFLFILGLFILDNRYKYWLLAATILSFMMSWGRNFEAFNYLMYDYFPAYNKFRSVTMAMFIAQLAIPIMAVLAVEKLLSTPFSPELQKKLFLATGTTAGLAFIFFLIPSLAGDFTSPNDAQSKLPEWLMGAIYEERENMLRMDALRSVFFILTSAGILWASITQKIKAEHAAIGLVFLTLTDLWMVDKRYLNKDNFEKRFMEAQFTLSPADEEILKDKSLNYRVLNLNNPFNESKTSYFHQSIGGYSPVKIRRYQDLIENDLSVEIRSLIEGLNSGKFTNENLEEFRVLNMLNTKYFKAGEEAKAVIENTSALGNAWFVPSVIEVKSPDEDIAQLNKFNPKADAVVDINKFKLAKTKFDTTGAKVSLVEAKANYLKYETENPHYGFLVFSEIYYPEGWEVLVDGKPTNFIRANYVLRGMELAEGKHTIEFKFNPGSFRIGEKVSMFSSIAVLGMLLAAITLGFISSTRQRKEDEVF